MRTLALLFVLAQAAGVKPPPATDITAAAVEAALKEAIATKTIDTPIRTVDAGGHNVGVGLVHRPKGTNLPGGASHATSHSMVRTTTERSGPSAR